MGSCGLSANSLLSPFIRASLDQIRTVPELLNFNALNNPNHPFCIQTLKTSDGSSPTFLEITFAQLKEAVLRCSAWLTANIGELSPPRKDHTNRVVRCFPVALLVDSNVGLLIHEYGLMCLGVPVLLLSARLSPSAISHLLVKTAAKAIIVSPRSRGIAAEALSLDSSAEEPCTLYLQSQYESFLQPGVVQNVPDKSLFVPHHYISETDRNVLILHSSGTTGLPKPIYTSHRYSLSFPACHAFSSEEEAQSLTLSTLPLYHGFGRLTPGLSLGVGKTFCLPISSMIPTGSSTAELLTHSKAKSLFTVPSVLEEITLLPDEDGIHVLQPLQFVAFGGGQLKPSVGTRLESSGVRLLNHYGATETGPLAPVFVPLPDYDWRYFRLRDDVRKPLEIRLDPRPSTDNSNQSYTLSLRPPGWTERFEVQDLLISNPQQPGTDFNAVGRNDDMIVLATGEKVVPRILETMLSQSELVKVVVAFGDGQFEIGVIVEPVEELAPEKIEDFKMSIWPIIEKANRQMDAQGWISSQHSIIVAKPHSIPRADKGSVLRREAYSTFEAEIKKAYTDLDALIDPVMPLKLSELDSDIKHLIRNQLGWKIPVDEWSNDDDLFELGMDSLQATRLQRLLSASLPTEFNRLELRSKIGREFVYQHPSIGKLAHALSNLDNIRGIANGYDDLAKLVDLYSVKKPAITSKSDSGHSILLTGSTGSLGSYALAALVELPEVTRVVCINRISRKDPYVRQEEAFKIKGITLPKAAWAKIKIYQTDLATRELGLGTDIYASLRQELTHIVHNAWPMDFKLLLPSFASQFKVLQNILNLAREVHASNPVVKPRVIFVSSIAVVGRYHEVRNEHIVPEMTLPTDDYTMETGYAKAKLVCERVAERASHDYPEEIEVACARFGQIAGAQSTGYWNSSEHMAALIQSSEKVGKLPCLEGTHSWLPIDNAASCLIDLLLNPAPMEMMYHVENPIRQSWHDTLDVFASKLNLSGSGYLPFDEWLKEVFAVDSERNPVKNLADFFGQDFERMSSGSLILGTERARNASSTLRKSTAVSKETIQLYVDQWRAVGFLSNSSEKAMQ